MGRIVVGVLACGVLAACGGDDDSAETAGTSRTATSEATSAPSDGRTAATSAPGVADVWRQTASEHRGKDGERFTIACPPGGTVSEIWGVETYTDDSSICTAAVHVGLITAKDGGQVEYEMAPGKDEYASGIGHGITSSRYGAYQGSFIFPKAPPGSGTFTLGPESWTRTASDYATQTGKKVDVECAPGGPIASVWGTGTYTSDSSICTAAVHAGLVTVADGGTVTIEITPGRDSYKGSTANGVTSTDYGAYSSSFTFVTD